MSDADDRRREQREPVLLKVEYTDAGDLVSDYTDNISHGGTFVLTDRPFEEGTRIRLVLSFPGLIRPLPVNGIVKWVKNEPPEERGVGVAFDLADEQTAGRLDALVHRIAEGDPELVAKNLKVLVVEDNPHVATLIRDGLAGGSRRELAGRVNFQIDTVTNGREALEYLASRPIDVLIIDIYLPVLDGVQVINAVRNDAKLGELPIVAVSAGGPTARDAALAAGADFFLDKPMRLADVLSTMRRLTGLA
jgi:uncharacterized protein (TIGR02266 family)